MNESTRKEAERAALVQRFQLDSLYRALQSLEDHLDALESESDRQRDELARLERKLADFRNKAGLSHPSDQARLDTQQTDAKAPEHHRPSPPETRAAPRPSPDLPAILPPPDPGEHWIEYLRNVERYIADHGIEVTRDPLAQLLPPHRAAEIRADSTPSFALRRGIAGTTAPSRWPCSSARLRTTCSLRRPGDVQGTASARKPADGMDEGTIEEAGSDGGP